MVTTEATRRAITLLQSLVTLEQALTPDQCAEGTAAVEAARLELERVDLALDAPMPTERVLHTYTPKATEVGIDVAVTTTGRTLAVKVDVAAQPSESDEAVRRRAQALSLQTVEETVALFEGAGMRFGKAEANGGAR
jgi:hypothetical protein